MYKSSFSNKNLGLLLLAAGLNLILNCELRAVLIDCPHGRDSMLAGKERAVGHICGHAESKTRAPGLGVPRDELKALVVSPEGCCDRELVSLEYLDPDQHDINYYIFKPNIPN